MTSLSDSDPVVFELDLRSSEAQLELIEQDEQNVETLPQNAVDKVTEIPRGIAHEATKSEVENSINQIISADSDSADSASSLFKTQCPLDVSQNVRRRHCSGPSIPSGASVQNIRRSNEPSTDSDEEASPHHVQRYSLARRRMHNERRRWPPLTGRRRQLYPSASRKRYLKIRKNKGVPFTFLKDEVGVNELPHKMILMYEQAALWGFFSCVQKQKFDSCLQKQLEDLGSGKDLELREHSYADESESISPIEVEGEDINSSDDEERSDAKFVDKSFLLTENSKKRFHEEDARNIDAQQQSGNERIRRISTKTVPNPEEEGETHGHEKPFEEATQKRDSGAKVHPAVINNMDHDRGLSEKPKKKKKAKKTIDKNFSDQIQGEAIAANTVNNQGIFGSEEDIETQIEVPFHHNCEEIPDNVIHEGEKEEAASLSLINDEDSNNCLTEKSKKKKKKTSKKKIEKNVSNHVQSGTVLASGENDEAFDGTEADDETQIELPFHPTYEEITERLGSEGEKEVSLSLVSNVGSDNYLTEKSKKKKTSKKNINKNFSDQVQSGTVQASRVNEAFCGTEADDETEIELPFQHNYAEVPERLSSEGEKEVSLSHVSDVDSSNYLTKKSKKKKTNKKNIDKNRSNRVQSGTVLASGENDEAFDGTEADDETQIERHFHPTYEEVPERLNSEGGKEYSQSLISDVDSSNYVTKKSKKKKTSKKNIDKNVSNHVQSGTVLASGENDEAFDGTEADDETQIELPFHLTYEEITERLGSEGEKEVSLSLVSNVDSDNYLTEKSKKKKTSKKNINKNFSDQVQSGTVQASRVNEAFCGAEADDETEVELPFQHNYAEVPERLSSEGEKEVSLSHVSDVDSSNYLTKKSKKKKTNKKNIDKNRSNRVQSGTVLASGENDEAFDGTEADDETQIERHFHPTYEEVPERLNSEGGKEYSQSLISDVDSSNYVTKKSKKKKTSKKNIDKNVSNHVQSGTVMASGENDEAFDGTEADNETQIERPFHPTYEEVPERLNSEGGKEDSQSLISDEDSSSFLTDQSKKKKTFKKNIDKNFSDQTQSGNVLGNRVNEEAFSGTEADDEIQIELPVHHSYEEMPERLSSEGEKEGSLSLFSDVDNSCFTRTKRRKKKKKKKSEDDAIKEDVLIKSGMAHEVNGEHGHDMEEEACTQHNVSFLGKRKRNKKQDRNDDSKTTDSQKQSKREMAHKINYDLFSEVEWSEESLTENAVQQDHLETTKVMNQTSKIEEESSSGLISVMGMTHFLITEKAQKKKKKKKQKEERDDAWKPSSWIDATRKGMLSRDLSDGFENNEKFSCHSVGEEPFKELSHKERKRDGPSSEVHKGNVYVASDGGNKCISSDIHLLQKEGSSKSTSSESHHFLPPGGTNQTNISMYLGTKQKITKKRKLYTYQESDKFHLPALD